MTTKKDFERIVDSLMKDCKTKVRQQWGTGWDLLSPRLQSALLAEALLIVIVQLDESIEPERIVAIINQGWTWIIEETNR